MYIAFPHRNNFIHLGFYSSAGGRRLCATSKCQRKELVISYTAFLDLRVILYITVDLFTL